MRRLLALGGLALLLAAPLAGAGPWLQPRGDAAATGFQPGQGPAWSDVALRVEVPGNLTQPPDDPPPLILEDRVLFMALPTEEAFNGTMSAFSVDRDTGELDRVTTVPFGHPMRMATDGSTLYLSGDGAVHARPLESGGHRWDWTWSSGASAGDASMNESELETCGSMALEASHVTVLCRIDNIDTQPTPIGGRYDGKRADMLVARLDVETGEASWVWRPREPTENGSDPLEDEYKQPPIEEDPIGLAVVGNHVVVQTQEGQQGCISYAGYCKGTFRVSVRALDARDGSPVWDNPWRSPPVNRTVVAGEEVTAAGMHQSFPTYGNPAASGQAVYVKANDLYKLNIGNGESIWKAQIGDQDIDPSQGDFATAVSFGGSHVYTTTAQTVYRLDREDPQNSWSTSLNFSAGEGFQEDPIVTPKHVYAAAQSESGDEDVYAFDEETGEIVWRHEVEDELWAFSIGEGIGAYTARNTTEDSTSLVLLGQTEASLGDPAVAASTSYPAVGENVSVDLSGTEPGAFGEATRYKADWGDGTSTGWQSDPVLTHAYNESGDHTARFVVGNANQTSSTTQTFHVGEDPPPSPNMAQKAAQTALADGNVDITFGVLGLVMAVTGGAVGVARRRRKRSRLQDELDAIERAYVETKHNPIECEAQLTERKTHARGLLLDGELDESQFQVVENRVEELLTDLRKRSLDDEFDFLPHGLVKRGREMLEDGKVSALEADAFLRAVEEAEMLSPEQKAVVRERIEEWRGRDAGGGGAG